MLAEIRPKKKKEELEQSNLRISAILEGANNDERPKDKTLKRKLKLFTDSNKMYGGEGTGAGKDLHP